MKKVLFFAILFASCVFTSNAQTKSEFQIGLAAPSGDFADDDEEDAFSDGSGVAGTGFYLGYKFLSPLKASGLFWTFSAGVMYNDLQSDFKDDLEDYLEDADDFSLPKYINVPVLIGLQYEKSLSDNISLYGEGAIGPNLFKLTNYSVSSDEYESTTTFKPIIGLGFKIGAGIVLNNKYTIGLSYLGLGSYKVKYESEYKEDGESDSEDGKFDKALPISSLNITLGIRF